MKKTLLAIGGILVLTTFVTAQDFHLSQYDNAPLFLNPGMTGALETVESDHRINTGFRNQWASLGSKPFVTAYISYDRMLNDRFGAGGFLINNRSGLARFNTFSLYGSGSYRVTEPNAPHHLYTGLQVGLFHKSFNTADLVFDSQYSESSGTFDQSIASGEAFGGESKLNFDANFGIWYRYDDNRKASPYAGLSIFHVTRPNESFTDERSKLPMRFAFHGGTTWEFRDNMVLEPVMLFMQQAKAREINAGLRYWYEFKDSPYSVMAGVDYRVKDALVFHGGMKFGKHVIRLSYDYNTSPLKTYTGGRGGFEASLLINAVKGEPIFRPKF